MKVNAVPEWHEDIELALEKIKSRVSDEQPILHWSRLVHEVKENPEDVQVWHSFLTFVNEQRSLASSDSGAKVAMREAVLFLYLTATKVLQMSSKNRFSLAYLSIWIDLALLQDESPEDEHLARAIFRQLKNNRIGITFPKFWSAYAEFEVKHGDTEKAAKLLARGSNCKTAGLSKHPMSSLPHCRHAQHLDVTPQPEKKNVHSPHIAHVSHTPSQPCQKRTGISTPVSQAFIGTEMSPDAARGASSVDALRATSFSKDLASPMLFSPESRPSVEIVGSSSDQPAQRVKTTKDASYFFQTSIRATNTHSDSVARPPLSGQKNVHDPSDFTTRHKVPLNVSSRGTLPARFETVRSDSVFGQTPNSSSNHREGVHCSEISRFEEGRSSLDRNSQEREYIETDCEEHFKVAEQDSQMASGCVLPSGQYNISPVTPWRPGSLEASGLRQTASHDDFSPGQDDCSSKKRDTSSSLNFLPTVLQEIRGEDIAVVNGRQYLILGDIGKGGSSQVFKVLSLCRTILALKRVHVRKSHPAFKKTFDSYANEISLLRQLRGAPNIIYCHDAEVRKESGIIYLLMEYGDVDLAKHLLNNGKKSKLLGENFRRLYWHQMLEAVHTIHKAKIVHGDLKPANFLIVAGTLKLIDFGIANAIPSEDTTSIFREAQVGTPNYMAPEAVVFYEREENSSDGTRDLAGTGSDLSYFEQSNEVPKYRVGRASDIWSLGCILYQMVYGKAPFAHVKNMLQKMNCIQDERYAIQYPDVDDASVLSVLQGCLQREPKKRMSISDLLSHQFLQRSMMAPVINPWNLDNREAHSIIQRVLESLVQEGCQVRMEDGHELQPCEIDIVTDNLVKRLSQSDCEAPMQNCSKSKSDHTGNPRRGRNTPTTSGVTASCRTVGLPHSNDDGSVLRAAGTGKDTP